MRNAIMLFIFSVISCTVKAQMRIIDEDTNLVFTKIEYDPVFIGGDSALGAFIHDNMSREERAEFAGTEVWIKCIIRFDSSIHDFFIESNIPADLKKILARVFALTNGKWKPGIQNGYFASAYLRKKIVITP